MISRLLLCVLLGMGFSSHLQAEPLSRIAFGSCNKHDKPQPIWSAVNASQPQLWIWTGDIVYNDTDVAAVMAQKYGLQKAQPGYQALRQQSEVIGVWDDHDYGRNNAGKEFAAKAIAQKALLDFLDEPENSPRRAQQGVYAAYTYGEPGQQVAVILLDVRYERDEPGENADALGETQWQWLEKTLAESQAQVHILVSGIQIVPKEQPYEKWANFPKSRQRLFDLLQRQMVQNPVFISGDRHIAEISRLHEPGFKPIYEITASGMNSSWRSFPGEENTQRVGQVFTENNFGYIDIDWSHQPAIISLQIRGEANQLGQVVNLPVLD